MRLPFLSGIKIRRLHSAPIDCVIGLLLLALSALAILPSVAFFTVCALIAAISARRSPPMPRAAPARSR